MTEAIPTPLFSRREIAAIVFYFLIGLVVLAIGGNDYPDLHLIGDVAVLALASILALELRDVRILGVPRPIVGSPSTYRSYHS